MKATAWVRWCGAIGVGMATGLVAPGATDALADRAKDVAKTKPKNDNDPATALNPITISPNELTWGIDKKRTIEIYEKVIDEDYKDRYQKVQPGPDMEALDAEVKAEKDAFRASLVTLDKAPSPLDATVLRSEYTFGNKEEVMRITRAGKVRDFFFLQNRLWKVVDELPLGNQARWGGDFAAAESNIANAYGVAGRSRKADAEKGRPFFEVDWKDATTIVRAVDWQNGSFGLVFQELATVNKLPLLRTAKQAAAANPSTKPADPPPGKVEKTKPAVTPKR